MKILVIDDEFDIREAVKNMLTGLPLQVMFAADAISALISLKDHGDIKTIITDYRLPGLSGKEWIDILKHYHPDANLIVITGYEVARDKIGDSYKVLMKPFTKYQLLQAIGI